MAGDLVKIILRGASYHMKPSYGSMSDIEARTDLTVSELLDVLVAGRLKLQEATLIVWHACQAADEGFDGVETVGQAIFEEKLTSDRLKTSLAKYLLACLYAPDDAKKKFEEDVAPMLGLDPTGS